MFDSGVSASLTEKPVQPTSLNARGDELHRPRVAREVGAAVPELAATSSTSRITVLHVAAALQVDRRRRG